MVAKKTQTHSTKHLNKSVKKTKKKVASQHSSLHAPEKKVHRKQTPVPLPPRPGLSWSLILILGLIMVVTVFFTSNASFILFPQASHIYHPLTDEFTDPAFTIVIIDDRSCTLCQTEEIISVFRQELFPSATIVVYDYQSQKAQEYLTLLNASVVPQIIFEDTVTQTAMYSRLRDGFYQVGEYYVFYDGLLGLPQKYIQEVSTLSRPTKGSDDAPITLIELSDFTCVHCQNYANSIHPQLTPYVDDGTLQIVFMNYPVNGQAALDHALASECANEQNQFWEYYQKAFSSDLFPEQIAQELSLDMNRFFSCLEQETYMGEVTSQALLAQQLNLQGVPAFIFNGVPFVGSVGIDTFEQIISLELQNQ